MLILFCIFLEKVNEFFLQFPILRTTVSMVIAEPPSGVIYAFIVSLIQADLLAEVKGISFT